MSTTLSELTERAKLWRKDIEFTSEIAGTSFDFRSTWGIFSPEKPDAGSLMLIDHIDWADLPADANSIDLGCGYGILGMVAASKLPGGHHTLIDKDFVAVDYAQKNLKLNQLTNAEAHLSNGFDQVEKSKKFDLVMSNLPAKASKEQHYLYLLDANARMNPGAYFYVVTINGLREYMKRSFTEVFGNTQKIKQGKTYTVTLARKQ